MRTQLPSECRWLLSAVLALLACAPPPPGTDDAASGSRALIAKTGVAAKLAFTVQPSSTYAGKAMAAPVKVAIEDVNGNLVDSTMVISLSSTVPVLGGAATAVHGIAAFPNLLVDTRASGLTLSASPPKGLAITGATSSTFDVYAADPASLEFVQQPTQLVAGSMMSPAPTVVAKDAFGNVVGRFVDSVTVTVTGPAGATFTSTSANAVNGLATFTGVTGKKANAGYTLVASSSALGVVSQPFTIVAAPAAKLAFLTAPAPAVADQTMSPVQVQVQDTYGNPASGSSAAIAISIGASPVAALLSGTTPQSAVAGVATFADLNLDPAGLGYTLSAASTGLQPAVSSSFDVAGPGAGKLQPSDGKAAYDSGTPDNLLCKNGAIITTAADLITAVNSGGSGDVVCISGEIQITQPLRPKQNMTLIGVDTTARISGGASLTTNPADWTALAGGVFQYTGQYVNQLNLASVLSGDPTQGTATYSCYTMSTYLDALFVRPAGSTLDRRMLRVTNYADLTNLGMLTTAGQKATPVELGRVFRDDKVSPPALYVAFPDAPTLDPTTNATIEINNEHASDVGAPALPALIYGAGVSGVVVKNLIVEKSVGSGIYAGNSWTIQDVTVRFASYDGIIRGSGSGDSSRFVLDNVLATQNGTNGVTPGKWTSMTHSELSWNNLANNRASNSSTGPSDGNCGGYWSAGAGKTGANVGGTASVPSVLFSAIDSHHNIGDGMWTDMGAQYVTFDSSAGPSRYHHNERWGLKSESSCWVTVDGVELDHNGTEQIKNAGIIGGGVQLVASNDNAVVHNVIHDNAAAIDIEYEWNHPNISLMTCVLPHQSSADDRVNTNADKDNVVQNNDIYMCSGAQGQVGGTGSLGGTLQSRNNTFTNNTYHVADTTGAWWREASGAEAWTAMGTTAGWNVNEPTSTPVTPCSYP